MRKARKIRRRISEVEASESRMARDSKEFEEMRTKRRLMDGEAAEADYGKRFCDKMQIRETHRAS